MGIRSTPQALLIAGLLAPAAGAQVIDFASDATLDRWMYPFNGSPGTRLSASTFGAPRLEGFDDHDAQFIVGFDTESAVPTGLAASQYRVLSLTVTATVSNDSEFRYDPTYDNQNTYQNQEGSYPGLVPDADTGRPIHIWGVGYREGYSLATWTETSPFGFNPTFPPAQEARTAFMAVFDSLGNATDATNHLRAEIDLAPMAIGQTGTVSPGALVPFDTTFTFEIDLCDAGTRAYLAQSLSAGEVRFSISSLHSASGGKGGGTGDVSYPVWYTRENPIAQILGLMPRIEMEVRVGPAGDFNGDGAKNFFDVSSFLGAYNASDAAADLNGDCAFNFFDVSLFLAQYNTP